MSLGSLELSILEVKGINKPDRILSEFRLILILTVLADHRNIIKVDSNHAEDLEDLLTGVFGL